MTTEQNPMQDCVSAVVDAFENLRRKMRGDTTGQELAAFAKLSTAVDALRAAGEPVACPASAWENELAGRVLMLEEMLRKANEALAAQPAPSASVREDAAVADQIIGQIEDRFPNWRSYRDLIDCIDCTLHHLRSVSTDLSPLMAAGEAGGQDLMDRAAHILNQATGGPEGWSQWDEAVMNVVREAADRLAAFSSQPSRIDAAARASDPLEGRSSAEWHTAMQEATSPAKRDYAARVVTDGSFQEGDEIAYEVNEATGIGRVTSHTRTAAEPTRATDANRAEALHGADLGRWCSEHPNLAAITIEALRGQTAEPTREEIALTGDMIENMLDRIVEAAVYYEQAEGIYNGPAKQELQEAKNAVRAILALKPRGEPAREGGPLTADFTKSMPGGKLDDSTFSEIEDALDAINAPMTDGKRYMTLVERIAAIGFQPDPPTTALEPAKQE